MVKTQTVSQLARAERMRIAAEDGAQARAEVQARDVAVRTNMERLRAQRLAREAEDAARPKPAPAAKRRTTKLKTAE
jgi:hypothetical protein